jgi:hypothetical protein
LTAQYISLRKRNRVETSRRSYHERESEETASVRAWMWSRIKSIRESI